MVVMSVSDSGADERINKIFQQNAYLQWLESFTIDDSIPRENLCSYRNLLYTLWDIQWEGNVKNIGNDSDREDDGFELRLRYCRIAYNNRMLDARSEYGEIRVLEVLIALSMHIYDLMLDTNVYNSVSRWFWEMLENTGLDYFDDYVWSIDDAENVRKIVTDILQRKAKQGWFSNNGWHSTEVWYQMHEYLSDYF